MTGFFCKLPVIDDVECIRWDFQAVPDFKQNQGAIVIQAGKAGNVKIERRGFPFQLGKEFFQARRCGFHGQPALQVYGMAVAVTVFGDLKVTGA